jgi:hypothetical protein
VKVRPASSTQALREAKSVSYAAGAGAADGKHLNSHGVGFHQCSDAAAGITGAALDIDLVWTAR